MAKLAITRPGAGAPGIGASFTAHVWPAVRAAAVPTSIVLLALFLRVYRFELIAWTPDTYEQMNAAHRLVAGDFPLSTFYPPGVALTVAPAFVFFPQTLATQQAVVIVSSLVLVGVVYVAARAATPDRVAPILLSFGVAVTPQIVYFSRDGFFDALNATWIASMILAVPWLRGRSIGTFAAYGVLLAVAISVRATNPAFLPALGLYWADVGRLGLRPRAIWRALWCRQLMVAGGTMLAAFSFFAYIGGSLGHSAAHAPLTLDYTARNATFYAFTELGDLLTAPPLLLLAVLGGTYLWKRNRSLLFVSVYMMTVFPLAHVPLPFANNRYMLPSMVFALLLAAHAPAAVTSMTARRPAFARRVWCAAALVPLLLVGTYDAVVDGMMVANWPAHAAVSDEAGYRQLRPIIASLPPGSLVVSGGARGVRDSNSRIEYLDLVDYSLATDNGPERVDEVMRRIDDALGKGRSVYYMYTSVEGINITFTASGPGYQPYFAAAPEHFRLTEIYATSLAFFKLYKIEPIRTP